MTKYMYVFPEGGFNNICQIIWKCYEYSLKYNRTLVIDTRYICTFRDDIRKYLIFTLPNVFDGDIDILFNSLKNTSTFYPKELKDVFTDDKINYKTIVSQFKFTKKGYLYNDINLTINLNKDYEEDIIFYAQCKGGNGILNIFKNVKLYNKLKDVIKNRISKLPKDYVSIHIRNTDRVSNMKEFIKNNHSNFVGRNLFVASDNLNSIKQMKTLYKNVYSFSNIPDIGNKAIHANNWNLNKEEFIIDCIADIFLLCYGKEYYFSCIESGYSKNIILLRDNIDILNNLIK